MKLFVNLIIKVLIFKSIGAEELARDHLTKIENKSDTTFGANEEPIPSESFDDTTTEFASLSTSTDEDRTTTQMDERCSITSHNYTLDENNNLVVNWSYVGIISCDDSTIQVWLKNITCEAKCLLEMDNSTNLEADNCQTKCSVKRNDIPIANNYLRPFALESCTKYKYVLIFSTNLAYESEEFWSNLPKLQDINISDSLQDSPSKILDLYVSWNYDVECAEKFVVNVQYDNNMSDKTVNELSTKFDDISACSNYTVTVSALIDFNTSVSNSSFYMTSSVEPSQIKNLTVSSEKKTIAGSEIAVFKLSWEKPAQGSQCVKIYKVYLESEFDNRTEEENADSCSNTCSKEIYEVIPCVDYSIRIGVVNSTLSDEQDAPASKQSDIIFNLTAFRVPFPRLQSPNITNESNTTFDLSVEVDTNKNKCEIKEFQFQCINETIDSNRTEKSTKSNITLNELEPDTEYLCSVRVLNVAGWSEQGSHGSRKTKEGSPSAPNLKVQNETIKSSEFTIVWEKPSKPRGDIKTYVINIKFTKFLYRIPDYCPHKPNNSEFDKVIYVNQMNDTIYTYTEASPSSEYLVRIRANNLEKEGEWSTQESLKTASDKSEPVLLSISQNQINLSTSFNNTAILQWKYPCKSNSDILSFEIHHSLGNQNFTKNNVTFEFGKYDYEYGLNLTPSVAYKISILPFSDQHVGKQFETNFTLDAGVPEDNHINSIIKNIKIQDKAKQTVTLTQLQNLFNSSVGRVEQIIFLLHQTDCNLAVEKKRNFIIADNSDEIPNYSNPSKQKCIGQYKTAKILNYIDTFTIGYESCTNQLEQICNGPLNPGTHYALVIRFFTKNGFADSEFIRFDTDKQTPIALITISFLSIMCIVFIIGFYITYRNPRNSVNKQFDREDVPVQNFNEFYNEMTKNNKERIREEFKQIQFFSEGLDRTTLASKVNEKFNRYANISPFDSNRVVLNDDEYELHDYINASFINGYYYSKEYIAAQGPKANTSHDFWRMVLEYKIESIAMLTSLVENNKVKCHEYFPKLNGQVTFDNIKIVCINEQKYSSYIKRIMEVQKGNMKLLVKHYYFLKWLDHSACNLSDLIDFIKVVRSERQNQSESFIVHCSAGVGRTGTFVAVDILMQRIKQERKVNIFVLVKELRKQRMKMVQTFDQYALVYDAALEMTTSRTRRPLVLQNISKFIENFELFKSWTRRGNLRNSNEGSPKVDDKESAL